MAFWRPGAPAPPGADPSDLDCDAERNRALPIYNPLDGLPVQQQRQRLPIHKHKLPLLYAVETHRATILCGPTGCGKSTQVPQYLDEAGWTANGYKIGITVPRRVAAVTLAARVAQEMGADLGAEVGYKIRFDNSTTPGRTRIEFMTEGVLLREMLQDPLLTRYSVIVVDEAHERSTLMDLLLGLLKKILRKRPSLRLIVASATVDVDSFLKFFRRRRTGTGGSAPELPPKKRLRSGWDDQKGEFHAQRQTAEFREDGDWRRLCKDLGEPGEGVAAEKDVCLLNVEGRTHPVEVHFLEEAASDYVQTAVGTVMSIHQGQEDGDVLVFLTGREEIDAACALLRERVAEAKDRANTPQQRPRPLHVVPLHGSLPKEAQLRAFAPGPRNSRKVVVSTNIAEASITIDGVVYVVDACLVKFDAFCPHNGCSYLNLTPCSQSSARQRAGRAGRTRPGHCYRLLTEAAFNSGLMPPHDLPEVVRSDLKDAVLLMKCLGVDDIGGFDFVSQPSREAVELALEELYALGAIDSEAHVVEPLGPRMAHGPLPLVLMRLLLLSCEEPHMCAQEAAGICAMLSLKEPWLPTPNIDRLQACKQSFAVYEGDLVSVLNIFRQHQTYRGNDKDWCKRHQLNFSLLERAARVRRQLIDYMERLQLPIETCGLEVLRIQRLAAAALFLNAARKMSNGMYRLCRPVEEAASPHVFFQLHPSSVLAGVQGHAPADFVVFVEAMSTGESAGLIHNTRIKPEWLPELAPHYFGTARAGLAMPD